MTPAEAAARLGDRPGRAMLDSAADHDALGRWSFVASDPARTLEARGDEVVVREADGTERFRGRGEPLALLAMLARQAGGDAAPPDGCPWPVAIGYVGYDVGRALHGRPPGDGPLPDLWFGIYDACWRHDRTTGEGEVLALAPAAGARLAERLAAAPVARPAPRLGPVREVEGGAARYRAAFARIQAYLAAGDVYQVNLARELEAEVLEAGDPLALYRAAAAAAPAPCGALLEPPGGAIVSASPERFLWRAAGSARLETRPIKGTRKRTGDPVVDAALAAELAADPKELAEHLMIVDLERNDLGRIAEVGSVEVEGFARVVELPTVAHLVSTVACRLRKGVWSDAILAATFPSGSITGAPKRRAIEIIDEVEGFRRGVYTGAIGYLGRGGELSLSIAIRTATIAARRVTVPVGGGIVIDSTLARELEETEEKAAAWRRALAAL
jgi:para-aminobenzoate synthetase component 1